MPSGDDKTVEEFTYRCMRSMPDQISRCLCPCNWDRAQLHGEIGKAHRFLAVEFWVFVEDGRVVSFAEVLIFWSVEAGPFLPTQVRGKRRSTNLNVRINAAWDGLCQPVQRHGVDDLFERRCDVGPFNELFANPAGAMIS